MKKPALFIPILLFLISCGTTKTPSKEAPTDNSPKAKIQIEQRDRQLRDSGADFVAFGYHPKWTLTINEVDKNLSFKIEGQEALNISLKSLDYIDIHNLSVEDEHNSLVLFSQEQRCYCTDWQESMPYTVDVELNGVHFNGCGKKLGDSEKIVFIPAQLNDIWAMEAVDGKEIDFVDKTVYRPTLEINLKKMTARGLTGCNNFQADVIIDGNKINFPSFPMTQKYCEGYENVFVKAITLTVSYKIEGTELYFYDKEGNEVLRLKKVD